LAATYSRSAPSPAISLVGGALAGVGTTLSNGCTSGHGVCGLGRLSVRSVYAVGTFFSVGLLTSSLTPSLHSSETSGGAFSTPSPLGNTLTLLLLSSFATLALVSRNARPTSVLNTAAPSLAAGALFSAGLMVSGMGNPAVVRAFLNLSDLPDSWNATLAFVMAGACTVSFLGYQVRPRAF